MSKMFPEAIPAPFGPDDPSAAAAEEARRGWALELAVQLHAARPQVHPSPIDDSYRDRSVIATAKRFAAYLRGGDDA